MCFLGVFALEGTDPIRGRPSRVPTVGKRA